MTPTNEQLSAFLDAELSLAEMEQVRQALASQPELADRLAQLAEVDSRVQQFAATIGQQELSPALAERLRSFESAKVLPFQRRPLTWLAAAASVTALAFLVQFGSAGSGTDPWPLVQQGLEQSASGQQLSLADGQKLEVQFSFLAQNGHYCRVYQLSSDSTVQQQLACRDQQWTLIHSESRAQQQGYQTASHSDSFDAVLDKQMSGTALSPQQERQLLQQGWSEQP